jgi:hypothetical protein
MTGTPTTCFSYMEDKLNPEVGAGVCLEVHVTVKDDPFPHCRPCEDVLREGKCPRRHKSPYLKAGERA